MRFVNVISDDGSSPRKRFSRVLDGETLAFYRLTHFLRHCVPSSTSPGNQQILHGKRQVLGG